MNTITKENKRTTAAPKGRRSVKDGVRTEEKIMTAAQELFAKQGYDSVTIRDISAVADSNQALVSYYFGDKEGLYRACLERIGSRRLAYAERILVTPQSIDEVRLRLRLFVEEIIESYLSDPYSMLLVYRECESPTNLSEDIFRKIFIAVFVRLKTFLKEAQSLGVLKKDLDTHMMAIIFFGMVVHLTKTDMVNEKYFNVSLKNKKFRENVAHSLLQIFLNGSAVK